MYHPSMMFGDLEHEAARQGTTINELCKAAGIPIQEYAHRRANQIVDHEWFNKLCAPLGITTDFFFPEDRM